MSCKFEYDELRTIAGENTPEKIAERLLRKRATQESTSRSIEMMKQRDQLTIAHGRGGMSFAAEIHAQEALLKHFEIEIAADEDRLMAFVLDGKTRLERKL